MINEIRTIVEKENEGNHDPFSVTVTFPQNGILVTMRTNPVGIELRIWYRNDSDCYETIKYHGSVFSINPDTIQHCQSLVSQVFEVVQREAQSILESEE